VAIVGPEGGAIARELRQSLSLLEVWADPEDGASGPEFEAWIRRVSPEPPAFQPQPSDLAVQLYTSGTTGRPKGAMLTQGSFVEHLGNMVDADVSWNRWSADDVSYLPMPLSHIGGTGWGLWGIYHGALTVIERQFTIDAVFDRIERNGITKLFVVPAALQQMVRHSRARSVDYSRIRNINYGASPISPTLLCECIDVFGSGFTQMYGMTETIGTVVALTPEDHLAPGIPKIRSAGRPLPGVEVAVQAPDGRLCSPGEIGEVLLRSVACMAGYWRLPEETARTIDEAGWLHTGDAGYLDEDGYLYIHDRLKDMIITGGENVFSVEVEAALCEHPAVADAAVIGIPSERWGEEVVAMVVTRAGFAPSPDDLARHVRDRLAGFKVPRGFHFVEDLPRNPSGKVLKRQLREPFWRDQTRQVS
jgi:fatty-acyl-CoA synthase